MDTADLLVSFQVRRVRVHLDSGDKRCCVWRWEDKFWDNCRWVWDTTAVIGSEHQIPAQYK